MYDRKNNMAKIAFIISGVVLVLFLGFLGIRIMGDSLPPKQDQMGKTVTATPVGGPFTLMSETGKVFTQDDIQTPYKLVFFGFTSCPAICPTELLKITDVMNGLDPAVSGRITPLFISVDPDRDTPAQLLTYTDQFDPRIIGLTGSHDQIDHVFETVSCLCGQGCDRSNETGWVYNGSFGLYLSCWPGPYDGQGV
jgi:cytochrome oxidase Cu insertion factor (SCO1/SenC/PrrC family)